VLYLYCPKAVILTAWEILNNQMTLIIELSKFPI
jgi:hypothetical protein